MAGLTEKLVRAAALSSRRFRSKTSRLGTASSYHRLRPTARDAVKASHQLLNILRRGTCLTLIRALASLSWRTTRTRFFSSLYQKLRRNQIKLLRLQLRWKILLASRVITLLYRGRRVLGKAWMQRTELLRAAKSPYQSSLFFRIVRCILKTVEE